MLYLFRVLEMTFCSLSWVLFDNGERISPEYTVRRDGDKGRFLVLDDDDKVLATCPESAGVEGLKDLLWLVFPNHEVFRVRALGIGPRSELVMGVPTKEGAWPVEYNDKAIGTVDDICRVQMVIQGANDQYTD